jgi:hypothetical protein
MRVTIAGLAAVLLATTLPTYARDKADATGEPSAQRRPARVTVYPRPARALPANAKRECRAWLEQEFRPSGTVIVPRMNCWWVY